MNTHLKGAKKIYSESGLLALISRTFQFILNQKVAPCTPRIYQRCNKVTIRHHRIGEICSAEYDTGGFIRPTYEEGLRRGAQKVIQPGDDVTILGGGAGVVTTHASRYAGPNGSVRVFEASQEMVDVLEETIRRNRTSAPVEVNHAVVGDIEEVWGELGSPENVCTNELPSADVYIIDIEGAELEILNEIPQPRAVVVESHGVLEAPTNKVIGTLLERGYNIKTVGVAEPSREEVMNSKDVRVTVATK
ncbi:hypothetical protein [Halohasta salina]|uniref:hypothetical protein n=1 Tax=Halohasta salina TaxID=2961621 RepID=UPI0020A3DFBD|nr:hypothetical protein [Halohasta salina]